MEVTNLLDKDATNRRLRNSAILFPTLWLGVLIGVCGHIVFERLEGARQIDQPRSGRLIRGLLSAGNESSTGDNCHQKLLAFARETPGCYKEMTSLIDDLAKLQNEANGPPLIQGNCTPNWSYLEETNSCYYHHSVETNSKGEKLTYSWWQAESICKTHGAHLASIHSDNEIRFINELIHENISNPYATLVDSCARTDAYTWVGFNEGAWSDGTPLDNLAPNATATTRAHVICNRHTGPYRKTFVKLLGASSGEYGRFLCKRKLA